MENLIFEGIAGAIGVLIVMYFVFTSAKSVNLKNILDSKKWYTALMVSYWLLGILFASFIISGFVNHSILDTRLISFLFVVMVGAGILGLRYNKND